MREHFGAKNPRSWMLRFHTQTAGSTLTWVNNDSTTHTATGGAFNTGNVNPGGNASVTFPTAGTFTYHCTIHPNMVGTINV